MHWRYMAFAVAINVKVVKMSDHEEKERTNRFLHSIGNVQNNTENICHYYKNTEDDKYLFATKI